LIYSADSMPRIVTAAVSNRFNPSIGRICSLLDRVVQVFAGSHLYAAR
jgi:hypothetical protein